MNNVNDYIMVYNAIPKSKCDWILSNINNEQWEPHTWYNPENNQQTTRNKEELDVLYSENKNVSIEVENYIRQSLDAYKQKYNPLAFVTRFSRVRFNKYSINTNMAPHADHIHTVFDGKERGIPVISLVGILNEEYDGGEFVFNNNYEVKLKTGDILMFPSNFMYAHEVKGVKKGTRVSFVSWAY